MSARRQLQFMRQQENEPLEEFSQRVYFMALDGYDRGNPEVVDQIATETFLRGCRDKEAARSVLEKDPTSINQAMKLVKTYIANQRAIFGIRSSHSYAHRQVSFSDRESTPESQTREKTKENTNLAGELRDLISVVQKLGVTVGEKLGQTKEQGARFQQNRYRSPTPAGFRRQNSGQSISRSPSPFQRTRPPQRGSSNSPFRRDDASQTKEKENLNQRGSSPATNAWLPHKK